MLISKYYSHAIFFDEINAPFFLHFVQRTSTLFDYYIPVFYYNILKSLLATMKLQGRQK